ncbi:MAG: hypothetical protein U0174_03625 [Polyangiaceae bacterium]
MGIAFREAILLVEPIACVVPSHVFDAFNWCTSDELQLRLPPEGLDAARPLTSDNPPGMAFVFTSKCDFLPSELASLHVPKLSHPKERILAPYAIDDATDDLYGLRVPPGDVMCLATDSFAGVFWGLHDWAHFHNHGPFEERAYTELQCDLAAITWLARNRETLSLGDATLDRLLSEWEPVARGRFEDEGRPVPPISDLWREALARIAGHPGRERA